MNWWLTFHLLGIILWGGGLLASTRIAAYLPREAPEVQPRFAWMAARLYWLVATPGIILAVITAAGIFSNSPVPYTELGWFHGKMALVAILVGLHALFHVKLKALRADPAGANRILFSAVHGTIGLLIIGILIMVRVRPF